MLHSVVGSYAHRRQRREGENAVAQPLSPGPASDTLKGNVLLIYQTLQVEVVLSVA